MAASVSWSPWQPVLPEIRSPASTLAETVDGGQAFRWKEALPGIWQGQWLERVVRLRAGPTDVWEWSTPEPVGANLGQEVARYLAAAVDFATIADALPWRSDPVLAGALKLMPGLRIVRQPLGETLLGFLCSSNKQIVQIKQIVEALAERLGETVAGGRNALPTWERLAEVPEEELRSCQMGYRAKSVRGVAERLTEEPEFLVVVQAMPYADAKAKLMELPGVGPKVADCVLLFGDGRLEAFPIDTWIERMLRERYGLVGWTRQQLEQFARIHFGPHAGLAQQVLFASRR